MNQALARLFRQYCYLQIIECDFAFPARECEAIVSRSEQRRGVDVGGLTLTVEKELEGLPVGALDQPTVAAAGFEAGAAGDAFLFMLIQPGNASEGVLPASNNADIS